MKKLGFTLAEVLIALAIIGVVAAVTLPNLINDYQKDVWANSLSVAVSDFERAMSAMIMRDGVNDLTETEAWKYVHKESELYSYSSPENIEGFIKNIQQVLKVDDKYKNFKELYEGLEVKSLDGTVYDHSDGFFDEGVGLLGKNEIFYSIFIVNPTGYISNFKESEILNAGGSLYKKAATVYIDVNGSKKPNVWGKDIFFFALGVDGTLYPRGGKDYSIFAYGDDTLHWTKKCTDTDKGNGVNCTGRLVENNYKMDY